MKHIDEFGDVYYYKDGTSSLHREDGPAVELIDGYKAWYKNGKRHREDGPAVIYQDGTKEYWINGNLHREDGPAIEENGHNEYWIDGVKLSEENFLERIK